MSEEKSDPWFIFRVVLTLVVVFGGGIFIVNDIVSSNNKRAAFKADIKERCTPVYKTLEGSNVTSIYRCPDDTQYEFKERI